jgi:hypothetical protein
VKATYPFIVIAGRRPSQYVHVSHLKDACAPAAAVVTHLADGRRAGLQRCLEGLESAAKDKIWHAKVSESCDAAEVRTALQSLKVLASLEMQIVSAVK